MHIGIYSQNCTTLIKCIDDLSGIVMQKMFPCTAPVIELQFQKDGRTSCPIKHGKFTFSLILHCGL